MKSIKTISVMLSAFLLMAAGSAQAYTAGECRVMKDRISNNNYRIRSNNNWLRSSRANLNRWRNGTSRYKSRARQRRANGDIEGYNYYVRIINRRVRHDRVLVRRHNHRVNSNRSLVRYNRKLVRRYNNYCVRSRY